MSLADELLALPDEAARRTLLGERLPDLNSADTDALVVELKRAADSFMRSNAARGLETVRLIHDLAELTGNPLHDAPALLAEGNIRAIALGEYAAAAPLYERAIAIYTDAGRPVDAARSQIGRIWVLATLGEYERATADAEHAIRVLSEAGELLLLARLQSNLAAIYGRRGDDGAALQQLDSVRDVYLSLAAVGIPYVPHVDHNRGIVLRNLGRFTESIETLEAALVQTLAQGEPMEAARIRQSLAVTFHLMGRYNEALDLLEQTREVFWADGRQRDAILVELFISDCLLRLRRFDDVLTKCARVRALFGERGARREVAQALIDEAVAYTGLERFDAALHSLEEAAGIFREEGNTTWTVLTDLERAAVFQRQSEYASSFVLADEVLRHGAVVPPLEAARACLIAARSALALGRPSLAQSFVERALSTGEAAGLPTVAYQGQELLGELARAAGDDEGALLAFEAAMASLERLRGWLMVELRADFLADKGGVYEEAADLCVTRGEAARALSIAARAKSRALLDILAHRLDLSLRPRRPEDAPMVAKLTSLRAERDRLYRRVVGGSSLRERGWDAGGEQRTSALQEIVTLEKQITELWHSLLIRSADYARDASLFTVDATVIPLDPPPPGAVLVEYFAARGKWLAFVVQRPADTTGGPDADVQAVRLPGDVATTERMLQLLHLNLRSVPLSPAVALANLEANARGLLQRLHGQLVAPLAGHIPPGAQLIIAPHGSLHYLPFQALWDGNAFLAQHHEVSYLPGAGFLSFALGSASAPINGLCAVALGNSFGGQLPGAVAEARTVAGLLDGVAFLEEEATMDRLQDIPAGCGVIHLAAHADFRGDNPLFSGLALADGWLTTLDIFNLRLPAALVTLSACQTGRSVVGGGDELLGLMRAFLHAGASSLLLSHWSIDDASTADFMTIFYSALNNGCRRSAALSAAQNAFIQDPGRCHPYFWAPFFLVGATTALK